MKKSWLILLSGFLAAAVHGENLRIADNGLAQMVILEQPGATPPEKTAARELAIHLEKITGARFELKQWDGEIVEGAIVVGPGPAARKLFPEVALESFENEELIRLTRNGNLLLAGGRPRGTLYAVFRFLDQECGTRWWTPWAASIPEKPRLEIARLSVREKPAFEYREPFWYSAFDGRWAARNFSNGHRAAITPDWGGKIVYRGFVHTFNALVPPEKYFESHPEWFSFIDGKRAAEQSQLCLTNPELLDFVTDRVKTWLREAPENVILSISQNDWYRNCQCPDCRAIDEAEGSPSGSLLQFVNGVADRIAPEFPRAAIDTLAYQYTRRPPKTLRPRPNVIIRLCSIECNFAVPLEHPDNAAFAEDIRGWAEICDRLYVWDYTTDFAHYLQPHPNWFVLGPNARFFHRHNVRGLFEQGAYQSHGAEMAELRAWVLARLLWDPQQDDRALIREFLEGYYGAGPAAPIEAYLELMSDAAEDFYLTCFSPADAPFLNFKTLAGAERLWQQAIQAAETDEQRWRARQGHLPVRYLFLARWSQLQRECFQTGESWPLPGSRKAVADEWLALATGPGPEGWTAVTHLNESGLSPQKFVERFAVDPSPAEVRKMANPPPPLDLRDIDPDKCFDLQDSLARLHREGDLADFRPDPAASDGWSVWMPGSHREWAFQIPGHTFPKQDRRQTWQVYAVVRVDRKENGSGTLFQAGVYDSSNRRGAISRSVPWDEPSNLYRSYHLGDTTLTEGHYIWVAPAANPHVEAIWVDRIYLVPAP